MRLILAAYFLTTASLFALEELPDHQTMISKAPYISVVQLERCVNIAGNLSECECSVLENIKGHLPAVVLIRVLSFQPSEEYRSLTRWLVVLGDRTDTGFFPLRSHNTGRNPLYYDSEKKDWFLTFPYQIASQNIHSLSQFKKVIQK